MVAATSAAEMASEMGIQVALEKMEVTRGAIEVEVVMEVAAMVVDPTSRVPRTQQIQKQFLGKASMRRKMTDPLGVKRVKLDPEAVEGVMEGKILRKRDLARERLQALAARAGEHAQVAL